MSTNRRANAPAHRRVAMRIRYNILFTVVFTLLVLCFSIEQSLSADSTLATTRTVLIGNLVCGRAIPFSRTKLEAGLSLALSLSEKYRLITKLETDSAIQALSKGVPDSANTQLSSAAIAKFLKADAIVFARADRLQNMMRAELTLSVGEDYREQRKGTGFSFARFKNDKTKELVLDPALLAALQRALAVAVADSALYVRQIGAMNVLPASPLVVGGMQFRDDKSLGSWRLFQDQVVNSYDVVLKVAEALKDARRYVCYDMDTRDSIFALYHLFLIDNDREPSVQELDALRRLEVEYYITGVCERTANGALCTLHLCRVNNNGSYTIIKSEQAEMTDDDIVELRRVVSQLALKLCGDSN